VKQLGRNVGLGEQQKSAIVVNDHDGAYHRCESNLDKVARVQLSWTRSHFLIWPNCEFVEGSSIWYLDGSDEGLLVVTESCPSSTKNRMLGLGRNPQAPIAVASWGAPLYFEPVQRPWKNVMVLQTSSVASWWQAMREQMPPA
jgi:hypothetical protein